jgi:hypothetical protein
MRIFYLYNEYMIRSRRMRWAGHAARIRRREMNIGYWWESQQERIQ